MKFRVLCFACLMWTAITKKNQTNKQTKNNKKEKNKTGR